MQSVVADARASNLTGNYLEGKAFEMSKAAARVSRPTSLEYQVWYEHLKTTLMGLEKYIKEYHKWSIPG